MIHRIYNALLQSKYRLLTYKLPYLWYQVVSVACIYGIKLYLLPVSMVSNCICCPYLWYQILSAACIYGIKFYLLPVSMILSCIICWFELRWFFAWLSDLSELLVLYDIHAYLYVFIFLIANAKPIVCCERMTIIYCMNQIYVFYGICMPIRNAHYPDYEKIILCC